ncbi:class I SAM-dependent methyltransferase [Ruminiclostridium cellulolyticum]|uniref:Methyltransferase type 11 n=1 Tax=Ruminiclostridium cellulolyticum (strain ATCC 35319 / DSM 5812 / JCM 6584 / H10) TaxID=394503 RepID=B8I006_RUMCH|nr:class I SAM-dependent methyltransferase [Ruminiclostridium cellulolyticum]ACL75506.1 Methyltransferase type 11 [Ruminiclostridium cellulolyticum H10]
MSFYEKISKYYDYIFPTGNEQIDFLREIAGNPPKSVLDIACGTGGYSLELDRQGYNVTAVDLDMEMVRQLEIKAKENNQSVRFMQGNMLELQNKITDSFDLVFCIGNSIVHLENLEQIRKFLKTAKQLTGKDGNLVLQIINFDRIILRDIKSLPTIENKRAGLTFERNYRYDQSCNRIYFNTVLSVDGEVYENEIPLYPLREDDLVEAVSEAGFKRVKLFADFKGNEFDKYNSYMLVLWAR